MESCPEILSEKSANLGVQALRDAIREAWLNQSLNNLLNHLDSARELNTADGLLDEEIGICEAEIKHIREYKTAKFRETVS
jgi:hypothetical protein